MRMPEIGRCQSENVCDPIEVRISNSVSRLGTVTEAKEAVIERRSTRSCKKLIRFTPAELTQVNARALAARQPVACYIRDAALGARKRVTTSAPITPAIIHHVSRVATRLCGLRDAAEAQSLAGAVEFRKSVDELLNLIRELD